MTLREIYGTSGHVATAPAERLDWGHQSHSLAATMRLPGGQVGSTSCNAYGAARFDSSSGDEHQCVPLSSIRPSIHRRTSVPGRMRDNRGLDVLMRPLVGSLATRDSIKVA